MPRLGLVGAGDLNYTRIPVYNTPEEIVVQIAVIIHKKLQKIRAVFANTMKHFKYSLLLVMRAVATRILINTEVKTPNSVFKCSLKPSIKDTKI